MISSNSIVTVTSDFTEKYYYGTGNIYTCMVLRKAIVHQTE